METMHTTAILHNKNYDLGKAAATFTFLLLDEPTSVEETHPDKTQNEPLPAKPLARECTPPSHYHRPIFRLPKYNVLL